MSYTGFTGKILRVDLSASVPGTSAGVTSVDTFAVSATTNDRYMDYLGGTGLGYKVLWDEVPPGTKAADPANRLIFGVGPLSGTGSPCSGRVSVTSLWPVHINELPGTGHMGGHWGPELKYAGWDSIIIQGKAAKPVWIRIEDDKVTVEDAQRLWGQGIYRAVEEICTIMGSDARVAAMGQAGENLSRLACVICDRSHSANGGGYVMGAKNLKAIGVRGTSAVKLSTDKKTWADFNKYFISLMGANNQMVVPRTKQPWAEYNSSGSRWTADKGIYWGAATPPVETGYCMASDSTPTIDCPSPVNKIGLRTHKGYGDFALPGMRHTVKMNGCHACPIRCHIAVDIPEMEKYSLSRYNQNTCLGNSIVTKLMSVNPENADSKIINAYVSNAIGDDLGIGNDYGLWSDTYEYMHSRPLTAGELRLAVNADGTPTNTPADVIKWTGKTMFQKYLPAAELKLLSGNNTGVEPYTPGTPWALAEEGDPTALQILVPLIIQNGKTFNAQNTTLPAVYNNMSTPVLATAMSMGPPRLAEQWPELKLFYRYNKLIPTFKPTHIKHHGVENGGQTASLINMMWNRDPMCHTHSNYYAMGLPLAMMQAIGGELFCSGQSIFNAPNDGKGGITAGGGPFGPMTKAKAAFAAACIVNLELHNSLTQCNYTTPIWSSPNKTRNYRGDATIESKAYSLATGHILDQKGLETVGWRIITLFRALTARYMDYYKKAGTTLNMRNDHDQQYDWMFLTADDQIIKDLGYKGSEVYASGSKLGGSTQIMDRADMELAKEYLYEQFGWDKATGMPTTATLTKLGLGYVKTAIPALIKE